jgi:hypothetical protein
MNSSLTTFDGYPRDDIDIAQGALQSFRPHLYRSLRRFIQCERRVCVLSTYEMTTRRS